jgi:uncharacterized protein YbgA (DUF1722 family)
MNTPMDVDYGRNFRIAYLNNQAYLNPHPRELILLNYV